MRIIMNKEKANELISSFIPAVEAQVSIDAIVNDKKYKPVVFEALLKDKIKWAVKDYSFIQIESLEDEYMITIDDDFIIDASKTYSGIFVQAIEVIKVVYGIALEKVLPLIKEFTEKYKL